MSLSFSLRNCIAKSKLCHFNFHILSSPLSPLLSPMGPRSIATSAILYGEPLKKKKKIDPSIIRAREDRKKRKIEKEIRKLEKSARKLKPLEEMEAPQKLIREKSMRVRPVQNLSEENKLEHWQLTKRWADYRYRRYLAEVQMMDGILTSRSKALEKLREESEELYLEAIQDDDELVPFTARGPVFTPPIPDYVSPDGEYIDCTRKWE